MRILNRIVEWTPEGILYEGDQRHVEICMQDLGLDQDSREVTTPVDKSEKKPVEEESFLDPPTATRYRGMVARMNFLAQDRGQGEQWG